MAILNVGVVMDLPSGYRYHRATLAAIEHAAGALTLEMNLKVIPSTSLSGLPTLDGLAAVVIGPGSPYRDPEAVLDSVRSARERGVPLVAT